MTREVWALLGMCLCGAACSMLYDAFRAAHRLLVRHDVIVIISDVLYWIAAGAMIIISLWYLNTGVVRAYELVGLAAGAVIYFCTVSRFVYKFFLAADTIFLRILAYIFKILLTPARFLYKIIVTAVKRLSARRKRTNGG